jgi:hypothetical protein
MHFITFGSDPYKGHANRLAHSAKTHGGFDTYRVYDENDFTAEFKRSHAEVLAVSKGCGLWAFKSFVLLRRLAEMKDGDLLCYTDSLYLFKTDIRPYARRWLETSDMVLFRNKPSEPSFPEEEWATKEAFELLGADPMVHGKTAQVWAGFILLRKTPQTVAFIEDWHAACADIRIVGDQAGPAEVPTFKASRNDQVALSLLAKVKGVGYPFEQCPAEVLFNIRIGI